VSAVQHGPEAEFEFFVYDDEEARYSFWMQMGDAGMALYDRPPEGHGMWLSPERDSDYEPETPSEELREIAAKLVAKEQVPTEKIGDLEPHEKHFVQVIHGTVNNEPDSLPDPVWGWMHDCKDEMEETA